MQKINDSYLDDLSQSICIDRNHNNSPDYTIVGPNISKRGWIPDGDVNNCSNCKRGFSIFIRKHHCRLCGKIFCYLCSNYYDVIPSDILLSANTSKDSWKIYLSSFLYMQNVDKSRVCLQCHNIIYNVTKLRKLIEIFLILKFDLKQLRKISQVCKEWYHAAQYILIKFREIQYKLPYEQYTEIDKKLLLINNKYIIGHNRYLVHLIKICKTDKELENVLNEKPSNPSCKLLMCNKNCKSRLTDSNAIILLDYFFTKRSYLLILERVGIKYLNYQSDDNIIKCYLPYLVYNLKHDSNFILWDFLINRCIKSTMLIHSLYWELQLYANNTSYNYLINKFKSILSSNELKLIFTKIIDGSCFLKTIDQIYNYINNGKTYDDIKDVFNLKIPCILPLNTNITITNILLHKIKLKDSATKPMIIPCTTVDNKIYTILAKSEDVRKDQIIMNIIYLMEHMVKLEENIDLELVRYNILPTGNNKGLIEIVDNADTIYYIQEKLQTNIINYIIEENENIKIGDLRHKFIKSTSAYCVITYLLGIGDRHLDNIMINRDGRLFHIDFSYILGMDPVFTQPGIRITPDIIDTIGGVNSKYYNEFKELCTKIYNCLRRNIDIFIQLIMLIPDISDLKVSKDSIKELILQRFIPGENNIDANLHIVNQLEKYNYTDKIKDWCHYYRKEKTVSNTISQIQSAISSIWAKKNEI